MAFSSVAEEGNHVPPVRLEHWNEVSFLTIADFAPRAARAGE